MTDSRRAPSLKERIEAAQSAVEIQALLALSKSYEYRFATPKTIGRLHAIAKKRQRALSQQEARR